MISERIRQIVSELIKLGAHAVYVSDKDGLEICYIGDTNLKSFLQLLPSVRTWIQYQLDMNFLMSLQARYNLNIACDDIPIIQLKFKMGAMNSILMSYHGLSIGCIYPNSVDIDPRSLLKILREIFDTMAGSAGAREDIIDKVRHYILEARKNISAGDREGLVENLEHIKTYLLGSSNPNVNRYITHIERLLDVLRVADLGGEVERKAKRSLLLLFRNIIKSLETAKS